MIMKLKKKNGNIIEIPETESTDSTDPKLRKNPLLGYSEPTKRTSSPTLRIDGLYDFRKFKGTELTDSFIRPDKRTSTSYGIRLTSEILGFFLIPHLQENIKILMDFLNEKLPNLKRLSFEISTGKLIIKPSMISHRNLIFDLRTEISSELFLNTIQEYTDEIRMDF